MKEYKFDCGCSFPILEDSHDGTIPLLDFDAENIRYDCPAVFKVLSRGGTKGVFQLESNFGKSWTKRLKPDTIDNIVAMGAILRPGCTESMLDGVSMTTHFIKRKNKDEEVKPYHPAIDKILESTYGILVYQEQAMAIAVAIAMFSEQDADSLRKSIGKKDPIEMAKCKIMFLDGAKKAGIVSDEQAKEIFDWIEKSQRYSFNLSHAYCYGLTGYDCAYIKTHFPLAFFTAWLISSKHKGGEGGPQQEVFELVNDAKLFDVIVEPPDLRSLEKDFHSDRKVVKFGLSNIKGIGNSQINKIIPIIKEIEKNFKPIAEWSWYEFITRCSSKLSPSIITKLIECGALSWFYKGRQLMLSEFAVWNSLTEKEQDWYIQESKNHNDLLSLLKSGNKAKKDGGAASNKNRVSIIDSQIYLLEHPASSMEDSPNWIAYIEEELLGISLTCSKIDSCDISEVNCSCKEFLTGRTGYMVLGVEVQEVKEIKTKNGKSAGSKMAVLTIGDSSCAINAVCFPEDWKENQSLLTEGNTVIIQGQRSSKKDDTSFIIKKVWQAINS